MSKRVFSAAALANIKTVMSRHVESGSMPGLGYVIARGANAHIATAGTLAFDSTTPMRANSIARIASLSKPIIAVAAMLLIEDEYLSLYTPVEQFLPELANRQVLRSLDAPLTDTVPARRSMTLHDLLSFRLGFGCIMAPPATYPIQVAEASAGLMTLGPPWPPTPLSNDEWLSQLGQLPLMHQPGDGWMYNTGAQVLGVLVERAVGKPLEQVLQDRIFEPLGMKDTGFSVPARKQTRFMTAYAPDPLTGTLRTLDEPSTSWWRAPPAMPNAAGWLVSTLQDYWSFVRLLVNRGVHDGQKLLSTASIDLMLTDQLTDEQRAQAEPFVGPGASWGLGLAVPAAPRTGVGFGWDGGTGTTWRTNRDTGLTGILFTQRCMTSPAPPEVFVDFWNLVAHL
jgi:CubicO group peptidase (beta-lactamase class C family)